MELRSMGAQHYEYSSAEEAWADGYIAPRVIRALTADGSIRRVLDAGCGNGNLSARIAAVGFAVSAFDASTSGVEQAQRAFPGLRFEVASAYDNLRERFGDVFDACVCVEVIEHLYDPRTAVSRIFDVLRPGGLFVLTTPYHGYLKNLALAVTGSMDNHYTALWDGGHIKFWSRATLTTLLEERGFEVIRFEGAGRVPFLWKSMIVTARKS
jgi:2-polyprenyl-6-hydroxyphenyl methylase/3-demethylubiquinone-9 3-methyltransferase